MMTFLSHYAGWPRWQPKILIRAMSMSLMGMILILFVIYFYWKREGLHQITDGLMISLFGVTLMSTRGFRDWMIQIGVPLALFAGAAFYLRVPLSDLMPFLFGPMIMVIIGFLTSEALRNLSINQFLTKQSLRQLATTDQLTGLMNRHAFLPLIRHEMNRSRRSKRYPLSVILADLDHFKHINDRYGHDVGDQVLRETAVRVTASLRQQDVVCRWGGEEILIMLPETTVENAMTVADKIRRALADTPIPTDRGLIRQTISLGVARFHGEQHPENLIKRADEALYQAKDTGRNRAILAPASKAVTTSD
ncbi:response regulator PleD [Marinobacter santoriniensis NKSG1]|uniref:diguanylate cyclase n=2 Tax=Marinobacter santoriniensis TaxID=523742 RepID=M7CSI0_9GAMM|nr:response regulator PleD [Marinobacter santoriniensis NKSG1]